MGFLELPPEPDRPGPSAGGADRPGRHAREAPDPDERGRAYEAARTEADADASEAAGSERENRRAREDQAEFGKETERADRGREETGRADRGSDEVERANRDPEERERIYDRPEETERAGRDPEQTGRAGRDPEQTGRADRDPPERGRTFVGAEGAEDGKENTERAGVPASGLRLEQTEPRNYWDSVPRFMDKWAEHEERWPAAQQPKAVIDLSAGPPGSYRSAGGFELKREQHAETIDAIDRMRKAEPGLSADLRTVEQENSCGGWLAGFDRRLKGDDRLKEKVASGLATSMSDAAPEEVLREIPDAIRYTLCLRTDCYARGYYDIKARLESLRYEMYESKNSWEAAEYKGINTRWVTQEGQRFEIQFHTPESYHAKQDVTHRAYERLRNHLTSDVERGELEEFQREVSAHLDKPEGAAEIPDFRKEVY